ncbi:MAG: radical SAM protein [Lachnospiraceae bacterium]|nr:radical SAM protein [Lachnospiraceae bacterium]
MELMEDGLSIERHMFEKAAKTRTPIYGVLELLPLCNMSCDMCYVRMSREEMERSGRLLTTEEWCALAEEMKDAGTLFVLMTGGEPLLYPGFKELYLKLRSLGMIITINTNGTLIDDEWADFFAKHKPRRINITLYGAGEETYEKLCHLPGGFARTIAGIKRLKDRGVDVKMNGSLAKANVDERMQIIELGEQLGVPMHVDTYMYPRTRERSCGYKEQARLNPEEAADAGVEVLRREQGEELFKRYAKQRLFEVEHVKEFGCTNKMSCKAGKSSYVINWKGNMIPCVMLDNPGASVQETGFAEGWKQITEGVERLCISDECASCKYKVVCNTCAAAALAETGKCDAVPDYICRYTKRSMEHYEAYMRALKENVGNDD